MFFSDREKLSNLGLHTKTVKMQIDSCFYFKLFLFSFTVKFINWKIFQNICFPCHLLEIYCSIPLFLPYAWKKFDTASSVLKTIIFYYSVRAEKYLLKEDYLHPANLHTHTRTYILVERKNLMRHIRCVHKRETLYLCITLFYF